MKENMTKPLLGFLILILMGLISTAQEKENQVTVKITREVDGETKTFDKTYASEEEMKADVDLKEFIGNEDNSNLFNDQTPETFDWNGQMNDFDFSFNFSDMPSFDHQFSFFHHGDSIAGALQPDQLDDFVKGLETELNKHLSIKIAKDLEKSFKYGDSTFHFSFSDSNVEDLPQKINKHFEKQIVVKDVSMKKVLVTADISEFGKPGKVKESKLLNLEDLNFSPNPSLDGRLNLAFNMPDFGELSIKIYNRDMKAVFSRYFEKYDGKYSESVDLSEQQSGDYLLEIESEGKRVTRKIEIE